MVELALQITLVVLLLLTVAWCVLVHSRLGRLRVDRGEMAAFISALDDATARAEEAVRQMHEANRVVESAAQEQQRRARRHSEELGRLMHNAARVIKRLEVAVEQGATQAAVLRTAPAPPATAAHAGAFPSSELPGLGAIAGAAPDATPMPTPDTSRPERVPPTRRPARREARLDGLLHDELREALQGLR